MGICLESPQRGRMIVSVSFAPLHSVVSSKRFICIQCRGRGEEKVLRVDRVRLKHGELTNYPPPSLYPRVRRSFSYCLKSRIPSRSRSKSCVQFRRTWLYGGPIFRSAGPCLRAAYFIQCPVSSGYPLSLMNQTACELRCAPCHCPW